MELLALRNAAPAGVGRPTAVRVRGPGRKTAPRPRTRMTVDGKFFARDGHRFHLHGVTYGPFAPDAAGDSFPTPDRLRDDFVRMQAVGINSVRTYHLPPEWF